MDIIMDALIIIVITFGISIYYFKFPKRDRIDTRDLPKSYCIQTLNRMDIQQNYECAAFSSAFILRHFGKEVDGNELNKKYLRKLMDGTVSAKGIIVFFKKLGYDTSYYFGNVNTLKKQLTQGIPVIVFIRVFPDKRYLHFVPVIGYDESYLFLADSLEHTINCNATHYNRKIRISDFEAVWKIGVPFCKNSYFVIHPNRLSVTTSQDQKSESKQTM